MALPEPSQEFVFGFLDALRVHLNEEQLLDFFWKFLYRTPKYFDCMVDRARLLPQIAQNHDANNDNT